MRFPIPTRSKFSNSSLRSGRRRRSPIRTFGSFSRRSVSSVGWERRGSGKRRLRRPRSARKINWRFCDSFRTASAIGISCRTRPSLTTCTVASSSCRALSLTSTSSGGPYHAWQSSLASPNRSSRSRLWENLILKSLAGCLGITRGGVPSRAHRRNDPALGLR